MRAFRRADGLFDIEGRVEDSKPVPFMAPLATVEKPAGEHIHDIWIRLVIDDEFLIHDVAASSDATPFGVCKEAPATLMKLKGERIGAGWNKIVRGHLKGAAGCTHMMELLGPIATAAYQALWPFIRSRPDAVATALHRSRQALIFFDDVRLWVKRAHHFQVTDIGVAIHDGRRGACEAIR